MDLTSPPQRSVEAETSLKPPLTPNRLTSATSVTSERPPSEQVQCKIVFSHTVGGAKIFSNDNRPREIMEP